MSSIALKAFLNWLLILKLDMGIAGITLSTTFVTLFNAVFLGLFIYKKIKLDYKKLFTNFVKMLFAGALTLVLCMFIGEWFNTIELPKYIFEGVKILFVGSACFIVYTILNILFKMDYAQGLVNRLIARFKSID